MKIALFGYGKMGKAVEEVATSSGDQVSAIFSQDPNSYAPIDQADVCIDFSIGHKVLEHVRQCSMRGKPLIIGTTGWEKDLPQAKEMIKKEGGAALFAPNFSFGVYAFMQVVKEAARWEEKLIGFNISGDEVHHSEKKDAPSGTAKALQSFFNREVPFTSRREGAVTGIHSITFDSDEETITLTHSAKSRKTFAKGAHLAARWIVGKKGWYTLDDLFKTL